MISSTFHSILQLHNNTFRKPSSPQDKSGIHQVHCYSEEELVGTRYWVGVGVDSSPVAAAVHSKLVGEEGGYCSIVVDS